jgi:hypothetical protein
MSLYSLYSLKWREMGPTAPAARLEFMVLFMTEMTQ